MSASNGQRKVVAIAVWAVAVIVALAIFEKNKGGPYDKPSFGTKAFAMLVAGVGTVAARAIWPRR